MHSGEIVGGELYDLLAFFLNQNHLGTIVFETDSGSGDIVVDGNNIAMAKFGDLTGKDAIIALSKIGSLRFNFTRLNKQHCEKPLSFKYLSKINKLSPDERFLPKTIVQKTERALPNVSLSIQKENILNSLLTPLSVAQLAISTKLSLPCLQETLSSMVEEDLVFIKPKFMVDALFLFPKESPVDLSEREKQVFNSIAHGMALGEFLAQYENQTVSIADILVSLVLKKMVVMSDDNGKIMPPWYVYKSLGFEKIARPVSLKLRIDNSLCVRPNTLAIDEFVVGMWESQLFGKKIDSVEIVCPNGKIGFLVEKGKMPRDSFFIRPNDQKLLGIQEGSFVDIYPKY